MAQYVNAELANKSNRDEGWGEKTACFITGKPEIKQTTKSEIEKHGTKKREEEKGRGE